MNCEISTKKTLEQNPKEIAYNYVNNLLLNSND